MPHLNIVIDDTSYANARTKADAHNVYSAILVSNYMYCELIINREVLIFADLVVHLNHEIKIQRNTIFPFIVVCNV